jgi:hypothetical protein
LKPSSRAVRRTGAVFLVLVGTVLASSSAAASTARPLANGGLPRSSKECLANRAAGTIVYASPFGYDASAGIIDVYAAIKLHYFSDLCLSVDFVDVPVTESAYALVSADTAQVSSEGSAADTMVAEANGANMVGIATYGDTSDYALLTRPSITKLTQLEGGLLAYHSVLPVALTEMLVKAGVRLSKLHMVNDDSYNPLLLTEGKFDALQAYQSNEPFTLKAAGKKFRMWTPAQFGVAGTFNVVVVNRKFLAEDKQAAADFLRAEFHAFNYCTRSVVTCVGFLAKAQGPSFLVAHGEEEWRYESSLALDHRLPGQGVGVESTAEWAPEASAVLRYDLVKAAPRLSRAANTTIAASLYLGSTLIWP